MIVHKAKGFTAPKIDGFRQHPMADCPHFAFEGVVVHLVGRKGESDTCDRCGSHFLQYFPEPKK